MCHDALYFVRLVRADSAFQATKTHGTMAKDLYEPDRLRVVVAHSDLAKAFEGGRRLIEELKAQVPVWKRQEYAGGEHTWVGL